MTAYHATRPQNRLAIRRWGLKARDTHEYNYPFLSPNKNVGPAVYVYTGKPRMLEAEDGWTGRGYEDIWEVDLTGLPLLPDDLVERNAYRVMTDIPPERIRQLHPAEVLA